jgi:hypothetical protein
MRDEKLEKLSKDYINKNKKFGCKYRKDIAWLKKAAKKVDTPMILPEAELRLKLIRDSEEYNFGVVSRKKVTAEFVNFMVAQLQSETSVFGDFKYHISGTGTTAENNAQVELVTPVGTARTIGTQIEGAATNIYKTVATIAYTDTLTITEHAIFNAAYSSAQTDGTMMDRSVFTGIAVVTGDSIEFLYSLSCNAEA